MGPDGLLVGRSGGNPSMPDARALNEAALAARRAATQAQQGGRVTAATVLPAEADEYLRMIKSGVSHAKALKTLQAMRQIMGMKAAVQ